VRSWTGPLYSTAPVFQAHALSLAGHHAAAMQEIRLDTFAKLLERAMAFRAGVQAVAVGLRAT
jgi:hypothetical protein